MKLTGIFAPAALCATLSLVFLSRPAVSAASLTRSSAKEPVLSGVLRCSGGGTMRPLIEAWARSFEIRHPQVSIQVAPRVELAAVGFSQLLTGHTDLVDFVREPFPAEVAAFRKAFGYAPMLINVANGSYDTPHATDAIAIYVNAANPLTHLTLKQLDRILSAASAAETRFTTWGQLGLAGKWRTRPIHVYSMIPVRPSGNPPGIVNYIELTVLQGKAMRRDLRVPHDERGVSALQAIVHAVARDPDGIGYGVFANPPPPGVRALALARDVAGPYYAGDPERVADRDYPLSRRIYFGLNSPPGKPLPPLVAAFLDYVLSPAGQRQVSRGPSHFLPLTAAQIARSRQLLEQIRPAPRTPDTAGRSPHAPAPYLTADGAISIVGYNDMREMLESLDRLFERAHRGVRFALTLKGTRTAPAALASGRSLFAPMGAPFLPGQLAAYRHRVGADPVGFRIAIDSVEPQARSAPLAIFVPADNPLPHLTLAQLRLIFADHAGDLRWGQFGVTGKLANRPVHPYGIRANEALGLFMRQHALAGRAFGKEFVGLRESVDVVQAVGRDPLGIGFAALNRATPEVRIVPLARRAGDRPSRGTRSDVMSGRYPLDRYLLIYVRIPPGGKLDPMARDYLRLALSPEGQRAIASGHLGYLPLNPKEVAAERAGLNALP